MSIAPPAPAPTADVASVDRAPARDGGDRALVPLDEASPSPGGASPAWDRHWPLAAAAVLQVSVLVELAQRAARAAGVGVAYPLDDAYVHMAIARRFVEDGTWGVNAGEYVSATSSPLWAALLAAAFAVAGPSDAVPLVLNGLASVLLLGLAARWLRDEGAQGAAQAVGLGAVVLLAPLPFLAGLGMEHVLHALVVLALARAGVAAVGAEPTGGRLLALGGLAAAAPMLRYESLFVLAPLVALLGLHRRWAAGALVVASAVLPMLLYGMVSVYHGGSMVPHGLLLKTGLGQDLAGQVRGNLAEGASVVVLAAAVLVARVREAGPRAAHAVLFGAAVAAHLVLARVGWLYRYEAWLVVWGTLLLAGHLADEVRAARAWAAGGGVPRFAVASAVGLLAALAVLALPGKRAAMAMAAWVPNAVRVEQSEGTLARFVARHGSGATVAAHDIGLLGWRGGARIVDLGGLASPTFLRLRRQGRYQPATVDASLVASGASLAVVVEGWMEGRRPASLRLVGEYTVTAGGDGRPLTWHVLAVGEERVTEVAASLEAFRRGLPDGAALVLKDDVRIPLGTIETEGAAVHVEPARIAFYTNGKARFTAPVGGVLVLTAAGTRADGRGPRFQVRAGDLAVDLAADAAPRPVEIGRVAAGTEVVIDYRDDHVDAAGDDRNLYVLGATVTREMSTTP